VKLDVLFEATDLPRFSLPAGIVDAYGSEIGFDATCVYANFVASIDGVAAIPDEERSSALISGKNDGDRFIMGLLRACADAVLIGAGTLRSHPKSLWTPANAFPALSADFAELRRARGTDDEPILALATASGKIDLEHPAFARGGLVLTTVDGAKTLGNAKAAGPIEIVIGGEGDQLSESEMLSLLRERGHNLILTEGGPTLFGHLLRDGLIDELFLTISNRVAGRTDIEQRAGIVEDAVFLPDRLAQAELLSVRRNESHLFLRYAPNALENA
jgi:riboflavin biosynthesis pyrimidine reductase